MPLGHKDAAYVRGVVAAYRKAIDSGESADLAKYTSRGYTKGYLFNAQPAERLTNPAAPSFSGTLIGKALRADRNGAHIKLASTLKVGDSIRTSSSGRIIEVFRIYRKGKEVQSSGDECNLLIKTIRPGDTLYKVARAQIEDDFLESIKPEAERKARAYAYISKKLGFAPLPPLSYLWNEKQLQGSTESAFVAPIGRITPALLAHASRLVIDTPRVAFDSELPALEKKMRELSGHKPLAFMASEPSLASGYSTILSPYANATNTLAARAWQGFGNIRGAVPSLEISQAQEANAALGFASYTGFPLELMISENDLFFELGEDPQEGKCELCDPNGNRFEITRSGGRTIILKGK